MPLTETSRLEGAEGLSKMFKALGKGLGGKTLKSAATTAMLPVLKQAKVNAPRGTEAHKTHKGRLVAPGFLSRNVARKAKLGRGGGIVFVSVGVRAEAHYGVNFVEVGTKKQPAQRWLLAAMDSNKQAVTERFVKFSRKKILAIASKKF